MDYDSLWEGERLRTENRKSLSIKNAIKEAEGIDLGKQSRI